METSELLRKIRRLEIKTRRLVNEGFSGAYRSVFKGYGVEFSEVRTYTPGDDVRLIDWNVSSRYSSLFVKKLIEERELNVLFALDTSASSQFGTANLLKSNLAAELVGLIAFSAVDNGDRVGLVSFTDIVERFIPPKCSRNQVLRILRDILYYPPVNKRTSISGVLKFLDRVIKKRSIIFVISDFLSEEDFAKPLAQLNSKHEVIAISVRDKREFEIPEIGYVQFEDAESGHCVLINTSDKHFQERFRDLTTERNKRLAETFRKASVNVLALRTDLPYDVTVSKFFANLAR